MHTNATSRRVETLKPDGRRVETLKPDRRRVDTLKPDNRRVETLKPDSRRVETLKPGHRGGDKLKPLRRTEDTSPRHTRSVDQLKLSCRPERNTHGPEPSPVCLVCCRARGSWEWCCLAQRGSRPCQLLRYRLLANSGAPLSAVGSQRPCALAADCAPEVGPSPCPPWSVSSEGLVCRSD